MPFLTQFSPAHLWQMAASSGDPSINLADYLTLKSGAKVSDVYRTPADMVNLIVSNVFVIAGFSLLIFIILAGFKLISGDANGVKEAKTMIEGVLLGFIIMLAAFWIIQIIERMLGVKILF
jgi:hypothetical protein